MSTLFILPRSRIRNACCVSVLNGSIQEPSNHGASKEESTSRVDSLAYHDRRDLELICKVKKRNILFRIQNINLKFLRINALLTIKRNSQIKRCIFIDSRFRIKLQLFLRKKLAHAYFRRRIFSKFFGGKIKSFYNGYLKSKILRSQEIIFRKFNKQKLWFCTKITRQKFNRDFYS